MPEISALPALEGAGAVGLGPFRRSALGGHHPRETGFDVIEVEPSEGDPLRRVDSAIAPGHSAYFFD
jgi:crotonobetainyl-CoA:carnitine CoA-transferase CaiB-like acyl-CoA transferase